MIRRKKVWAVASFEFLSEVKRPAFIVMALGMPLFLLAYVSLVALIGIFAEKSGSSEKVFGIVDQSGVLNSASLKVVPEIPEEARAAMKSFENRSPLKMEALLGDNISFRLLPDTITAMQSLSSKAINGWFHIKAGYLETGLADSYVGESENLGLKDTERALANILRDNLLRGAVSGTLAERIREPLTVEKSWTVKTSGERTERSGASIIAQFGIPFLFTLLLLLSVIGTGMSLIQGTAVEKENRVVDVLLSSASSEEILMGKLLGMGGAGLLQVLTWFGMAGLAGVFFAASLSSIGIAVAFGPLAVGTIYFVGAYFFIGSLMLGTGALGSNAKEGQQWSILWILMTSLPMVFMGSLIRDPHNSVAQVLTWFPFSSYSIVTFRLWMDPSGIAWWEIVGPFVLLLFCTWLAVRLGARLFRLGLLLTGTRLKPSEILRQIRNS